MFDRMPEISKKPCGLVVVVAFAVIAFAAVEDVVDVIATVDGDRDVELPMVVEEAAAEKVVTTGEDEVKETVEDCAEVGEVTKEGKEVSGKMESGMLNTVAVSGVSELTGDVMEPVIEEVWTVEDVRLLPEVIEESVAVSKESAERSTTEEEEGETGEDCDNVGDVEIVEVDCRTESVTEETESGVVRVEVIAEVAELIGEPVIEAIAVDEATAERVVIGRVFTTIEEEELTTERDEMDKTVKDCGDVDEEAEVATGRTVMEGIEFGVKNKGLDDTADSVEEDRDCETDVDDVEVTILVAVVVVDVIFKDEVELEVNPNSRLEGVPSIPRRNFSSVDNVALVVEVGELFILFVVEAGEVVSASIAVMKASAFSNDEDVGCG